VERVRKMIMITDAQYEKLVADGRIKAEDLATERGKNQAETNRILDLALKTTYQLSDGKRRSVYVDGPAELFDAVYELVEFEDSVSADDMIRLEAEGSHRIIFINKAALDYIAVPTHQFEEGRVERDAEALDHMRS
jgi:hypothetical protein